MSMETQEEREAKWRRDFERLGRQAVHDKVTGRGYSVSAQNTAATKWLREREIEDEQRRDKSEARNEITFYVTLAILVLTILGVLGAAIGWQ